MNASIIELLNEKNIEIQPGLTTEELKRVQEIYKIRFPDSMKDLLSQVLPVNNGFYNWRDFSEDNVYFIKSKINQPFEDVMSLASEVYWNDQWGEKPSSSEFISIEVKQRLKDATKLIPLFKHRYIPMLDESDPPVLSIHGVDVIYYGKNLADYLEREFCDGPKSIVVSDVFIPFWSEIM